ncbi:MAG: hypothetical protein Kow00127_13920 [Bacteroidales bacterium]
MKSIITLLISGTVIFLWLTQPVSAQGVSVNEDGADPDPSAMLDVSSTTKGLLIPRMDFVQMFSVDMPAEGLIVYCTSFDAFYYYTSGQWKKIGGEPDDDWSIDGNDMYANNSGMVGIGLTTAAATHKLTIEDNTANNLLRLIGTGPYGEYARLSFGDGNYAYIEEFFDDKLLVNGNSGLGLTSNFDIEAVSNYGDLKIYTPEGGASLNDNADTRDPSAILDINSSTKGILIPRMTTAEISAIPEPADGLQVYNTTEGNIYIYVAADNAWREVAWGTGAIYMQTFETCGDNLVDTRDGNSYPTVDINGQCWFAANLNYGSMIYISYSMANNGTPEKYCYNNSETYCDELGGLYQWNEMMNYNSTPSSQGLCPDGWHVPSDSEWYAMENFLDPSINNPNATGWRGVTAGAKLKQSGSGTPFNWPPGNNGTNESGFTALPGGYRTYTGSQTGNPTNAAFWTSSLQSGNGVDRELYYTSGQVFRNPVYTSYGMAVRCVKDQ